MFTIKRMSSIWVIFGILFISVIPVAHSQNNPFGGLLGGLLGVAKGFQAKKEWRQIDPTLLGCLQRILKPPPEQLEKQGIGPSDPRLIKDINACYGDAGPPRLGVRLSNVPMELANEIDETVRSNSSEDNYESSTNLVGARALVKSVTPNGVADKAGFKSGDVIYKFNGHEITDNQVIDRVRLASPKEKHTVEIFRDGSFETYYVTFPSVQERRKLYAKIVEKERKKKKVEEQSRGKREAEVAARKRAQEEQARKQRETRAAAAKIKAARVLKKILNNKEYTTAIDQLFSGNEDDIVYLINTKSDGVMRGLRGNLVIANDVPKSCVVPPTNYSPSKNAFHREGGNSLYQTLKKKRLKNSACAPLSKERSNVLIFSKSIKSSMSPAKLEWILQKYNEGTYQKLLVADANAYVQKQFALKEAKERKKHEKEARRQEIEQGVLSGNLKGFGILSFKGKKAVCLENDQNNDALEVISRSKNKTNFVKDNLESLFVKMMSGECNQFFAKSESLKVVADAFNSNKRQTRILIDWLDKEDLKTTANEAQAIVLRIENERKKREEEVRIARQKKAERAKVKRQAEVRRVKARRQREVRENQRRTKTQGFTAILSCGFQGQHMSLVPCFKETIQSNVKLTTNGSTRVFKYYELSQLGTEYRTGVHVDLPNSFAIQAQNVNKTLVLSLTIKGKEDGKTYYSSQAGKFGVVRARN